MQRQSLGSPVSKLHHGGLPKEDSLVTEADDENKTSKPSRRLSLSPPPPSSLSTHSKPEKLIHLIPLLTLFCFLILYLSSHSPSQSDLEHFNRFNRPANHIDSSEIEDFGRFIELRRGDVLAIRSLRNLREIEKHAPKSRPPRKIADF
ncbi:hypothetical protein ACOSP7_003122 [Xanthoceras sorbifolium]|uniref:Uncharacterized protein n=1 Tax=Xanthoceras sorbifolium TaxID=99658 RepID=A0ABQ8IIP4_9ROSI|nr:hypothetical protein JRO89_XS01G0090100 [Xanthoceras sorbifolium]